MPMTMRAVSLALLGALCATAASAQILSERGIAALQYTGRLTPDVRARVAQEAKLNALERYIAETNPAKQRIFDSGRARFAASLDNYVLGATVLSEMDDTKNKTFSMTVKIDINQARFENALSDSSGSSPARPSGAQVAAVFVARTPSSVQQFDDEVTKRVDDHLSATDQGNMDAKTRQSQQIGRDSVSTRDQAKGITSATHDQTISQTTKGGRIITDDVTTWRVANANDVDQEMTGIFANAGMQIVSTDFIDHLDLAAVRRDFGTGDELSGQTLRGVVNAVKGAGVPILVMGWIDEQMPNTDPVTGASQLVVKVNARVYDLSQPLPRVISSIGPIQYAGVGPNRAAATTNAINMASQEAARKLVDEISVKGVR